MDQQSTALLVGTAIVFIYAVVSADVHRKQKDGKAVSANEVKFATYGSYLVSFMSGVALVYVAYQIFGGKKKFGGSMGWQ
jgi:hypothetical protein